MLLLLAGGGIFADWWNCLPDGVKPTYVGRTSCVECHATESKLWTGSDHDLAMDLATPETVLGNFDDAELTHFGITSRMYKHDEKYMVHTEGPQGEMQDFEIKYVLGVRPLQQYMVEFDRPADAPEHEESRVQVLRLSWDTEKKEWFYLSPPDVDDKLAPDDPLHWTRAAQNWNHMCADCHSTNVHKSFDVETETYHTTFSEIDVSCETCHGPASTHVQLARSRSMFWDRRLGYGLAHLKSEDSRVEIESCAPCHSRRHVVCPDFKPGESYYQNFVNELLEPETYYADGQILDEVYVYGSFIQSRMHHQDIRCSDCHDPHSGRMKHEGNRVCTSCHQHDPAKYDTPAHHRHEPGSTGSLCVDCHIPESPFMDVDLRRDHSFRIPRPDLSVKLQTPNACTGCHLEPEKIDADKRDQLKHYADWLAAARAGDQQVRDELARLDQWSLETVELWYGKWTDKADRDPRLEFAETLAKAWQHDQTAVPDLIQLAQNRLVSGMVRASSLNQLMQFPSPQVWSAAEGVLKDPDPQVRLAAVRNLENVPRRQLIEHVVPLLGDPIRSVRIEAARILAAVPSDALTDAEETARRVSLEDYRQGLLAQGDQAGAHMALGVLAERRSQWGMAAESYRTAIRIQPHVTGPRSNLAAVLERMQQDGGDARRLRREELELLERDVSLAPQSAGLQYRLGLSLYLHQRTDEAEQALKRACELEPSVPEFRMGLALLYEELELWEQALASAEKLVTLRPDDPVNMQLLQKYRVRVQVGRLPAEP